VGGFRESAWEALVSVPSTTDRAGHADVQAAFAATLVDEWVRDGVRHAVICPGSGRRRCLALALSRGQHPCPAR